MFDPGQNYASLEIIAECEAERKLLAIPAAILEQAWRREAQIEAVIDAVLHTTFGGDPDGYAQARHVGEWCARIAMELPYGPDRSFARRVGVLRDIDPDILAALPETAIFVDHVREYQGLHVGAVAERTMSHIVAVADEFASTITPGANGVSFSPRRALAIMKAGATSSNAAIIDALERAIAAGSITQSRRWTDKSA